MSGICKNQQHGIYDHGSDKLFMAVTITNLF